MQKSTILNTLNELPNKFDLDDFLERLIVIEKIDEGIQEAKAGKTISHDKVKKMVAKWHK
jgi:predicted transcriptional regulator